MRTLAAASVHACVTSPPYWGLRDYSTAPLSWPAFAYSPLPGLPPCVEVPAMDASLGLEPTLEAFIGHMVLVFREVHRVLRDDGTCWVNMGDCYCAHPGQRKTTDKVGLKQESNAGSNSVGSRAISGLKPKDLAGQPWRLAFALQADGWWLRQDVIWSKKNPMPESTRDRCTKAHEYFFLLAKSERYYWNFDAMQEPASEATHARMAQDVASQQGSDRAHAGGKTNGRMKAVVRGSSDRTPSGWATGTGERHHNETGGRYTEQRKLAAAGSGTKNNESFNAAMAVMPLTRNKRSVWHVGTEPFSEAHFATFPTELIEPCILASVPEGGTVLDCFGGSGTTGMVADRLQRNAVLCELNDDYIAIAEKRITGDAPLFAEVEAAP
jgi:DNA modification methylase